MAKAMVKKHCSDAAERNESICEAARPFFVSCISASLGSNWQSTAALAKKDVGAETQSQDNRASPGGGIGAEILVC